MGCNCGFRRELKKAGIGYIPKQTIYLDYNATTPVDPQVLGTFDRACRQFWANPSSLHICGLKVWEKIESARETLGNYFGCLPEGFSFCSSGSEALHTALSGILAREPDRIPVTTAIEHPAVRHPLRIMQLAGKTAVILPVGGNGQIDPDLLKESLSRYPRTVLVISPVNHETGSIQPVSAIWSVCSQFDCIVLFDAVQAAARLAPTLWVPFCNVFTLSSHKLYAPKGTGALYKPKQLRLRKLRRGGNQESGLFPGTENTPGILCLSKAIDIMTNTFKDEDNHLRTLTGESWDILGGGRFPIIRETPKNSVNGVLCFSLPWVKDMDTFMMYLNERMICVSRFSACTGRMSGPSRVLMQMGRTEQRASTSLRVSLGRWSKRGDIFSLAETIESSYKKGL